MKTEVLVVNETEVEFKVEGDKTYISSLEVAKTFGKEHYKLMQTIKESSVYEEFVGAYEIVGATYTDK